MLLLVREETDPDDNNKLGLAIAKARAENMPNDNIERTIKKQLVGVKASIMKKC